MGENMQELRHFRHIRLLQYRIKHRHMFVFHCGKCIYEKCVRITAADWEVSIAPSAANGKSNIYFRIYDFVLQFYTFTKKSWLLLLRKKYLCFVMLSVNQMFIISHF
jgi:hypothetical protein